MANRIQTRKNRQAQAYKALEAEVKSATNDCALLRGEVATLKGALDFEAARSAGLEESLTNMTRARDEACAAGAELHAKLDTLQSRYDMIVEACGVAAEKDHEMQAAADKKES